MKWLVVLAMALVVPTYAGSLREIEPIVGAGPQQPTQPLSPVPVELVERFVHEVADAWSGRDLEAVLADDFPDRARLLDALQQGLPFDARLRILSVGTVQTLSQQPLPDGRVSEVLVRVRGQIEFTGEDGQLQLLPTHQEWVVRVAQRVP
jgi:hypothetical protein